MLIPLWMIITISAALLQNLRTIEQRRISDAAGLYFGTCSRFIFGLPWAAGFAILVFAVNDLSFPDGSFIWWLQMLAVAVSQIGATLLLLLVLRKRNFLVANLFAKLDVLFIVAMAHFLFAIHIADIGWLAMVFTIAGILLLAVPRLDASLAEKSALLESVAIGIASSILFAFASLFVREAVLGAGMEHELFAAVIVLVCVLAMQAAIALAAMPFLIGNGFFQQSSVTGPVVKRALRAGFYSAAASLCWFWAFSLAHPANIRIVGQIELVFISLATWLIFKERPTRLEWLGSALIAASIMLFVIDG